MDRDTAIGQLVTLLTGIDARSGNVACNPRRAPLRGRTDRDWPPGMASSGPSLPALARTLGMRLVLAHDVDTDQLGTFTGEIPRTGYGGRDRGPQGAPGDRVDRPRPCRGQRRLLRPAPVAPMLSAGQEILAFLDTVRDVHILERRTTPTNFGHTTTTPHRRGDRRLPGAHRFRSPRGRRPSPQLPPTCGRDPHLQGRPVPAPASMRRSAGAPRTPTDGLARLETDMRAHVNPTRMREISLLADRLASRLATLCPACGTPGFGPVDHEPGLPCDTCGEPTRLTLATIHGCARCSHRSRHPREDGQRRADPTFCECCNP
jgi:hypothetical protein